MSGFRRTRDYLLGAAAILVTAGWMASSGQAADQVKFLTSWYAQPEYGGMYQAKATGLYEEAGLDVSISNGGPQIDTIKLLLAGEADFTSGHDVRVLNAIAQDIPIVVVAAVFQQNLRCVMAHEDVKSPADLAGKTIYVASSGRVEWWPWLRDKYGLNDEQVRPYTSNLQPFFTDPNSATQCYISSEPFEAQEQGVPVNAFLLADEGFPPYGEPILTTRKFLEENPDVVRRFIEATMKGWKSYLENPEPGNELMQKDNPKITDEIIDYAINQYKDKNLITGGDAATKGIGTISEERWKGTYDFLVNAGVLNPDVDWRRAFTTEIIDGIKVMPD